MESSHPMVHTTRAGRSGIALSVLAALGLLVGCSEQKKSEDGADEVLKPGSYTSAPSEARATGAVGASKTRIGPVAVDAEGYTLYVFRKDTTKSANSQCTADCAKTWPPALAPTGMPVAFPGIDANKLGVVTRKGGDKQITLNGHPLYRFSGDKKPGDLKGHGRDGAWYAASPTGAKSNDR